MPVTLQSVQPRLHMIILLLLNSFAFFSCNGQSQTKSNTVTATAKNKNMNYKEGSDYLLFERVRLMDNAGFTQPQEAYSILLPKGWQHQDAIVWNAPGTNCAGTYKSMQATSGDEKYKLTMLPDIVYIWNTDQQMMQFNLSNPMNSPYCDYSQPMDAETYLRNVFVTRELGNASVVKVETNATVVAQMQQSNEASRQELMQYGASQMQFYQSAVNATVRWANGREAFVILGVTIAETTVPNVYNGTYTKLYTTQVTQRTVFSYPQDKAEEAKNIFSLIMTSFRTNPAWVSAVNTYWKDVRLKKQVEHIGKINAMDAQTKAMGEAAIKNGQNRLNSMDNDMRSWEATQSTSDKIQSNFIKGIREVENYQDASGKYELTSSYDHAWSRGDGSTFLMSNNPNFDPSSVFQDQQWKEMKRVQ